jgi:hypothetical protein
MPIRLRREWLQKHPTPRHGKGDFHWFPNEVGADEQARLAEVVRATGEARWRIEPGRVSWAVSFTATAPADQRRYVGVVLTVAEPAPGSDADTAALLAAIDVPPAAPWQGQETALAVATPALPALASAPDVVAPTLAGRIARVLWRGGALAAPDPTHRSWPLRLATLETWLPSGIRTAPRTGVIVEEVAGDELPAPLFHYLGAAWALPPAIARRDPDYGRRAWRLAQAVAGRHGAALDGFVDELAALARAWNTAGELDAYLARTGVVRADERAACDRRAPAPLSSADDAGRLWSRVVHYWGRGLLAGDGVGERLASVLARRVVADHLFHLDAPEATGLPARYLRRLRWETLLPAPRRDELEAHLARHIPEVMGG